MKDAFISREAVRNALYEADAITMKGVAILNQFPAADAVEVVRCRECRFAPEGENDGLELEWPDRDCNPCPFKCEDGWYSQKPRPHFFCGFGKRKDGEEYNGEVHKRV